MNTTQLKRFATEARNKLKAGIAAKISTLGFDAKGMVSDAMRPELMEGGAVWNGSLQTEAFYHQWMSLYERVWQKGISHVYEETAYTWFNRLVAIRILQKNGLADPVMEYADSARTPRIVDEARQGTFPQMTEQMRSRLVELLDDDTKVTEQFALLISAWCHQNPIISACFGGIADYTELLLPVNILAEGQFVDMLNHTEFITDDDYRSSELIGWLYQFYISERKDEVFAKKGKYDADEIPAATQIFTPNWIVKYMVQNTVGRIYLDNNPGETALAEKWKYLVTPSEPTPKEAILHYGELEQLKVADLACGSGHILGEAFDLLYDLYIGEGYARREAIENIFRHNLTGIDLDTRAKQLATFALLLKACQRDSSFADAKLLPHVMDMPKPFSPTEGSLSDWLHQFFRGEENFLICDEIQSAFDLIQEADSLGSIMKFYILDSTYLLIAQMVNCWEGEAVLPKSVERLLPTFRLILALNEHYDALVMNPPYMGSGNMNKVLSAYVKQEYPDAKADLFSVFMQLATDRLKANGKYGMINMHSWMFLSSFEKLRRSLLKNNHIDSLLHLGPRTFDELSGEVVQNAAFVVSKTIPTSVPQPGTESSKPWYSIGTYFRLVDGRNCADKERMFLHAKELEKIYYPNVAQENFEKIPGCPITFWVSAKVLESFKTENLISSYSIARSGFSTGNNNAYIREWYEVSLNKIGFKLRNNSEFINSQYKYVPFTSGGSYRKWYGNIDSIVDWTNPESMHRPRTTYMNLYYKPGITWNAITSGNISCRYYGTGFLFEHAAASLFVKEDYHFENFLAFLNTSVFQHILKMLNPTLNSGAEVVSSVPILFPYDDISTIVLHNITISKQDWDSHETSWDFEANPLVALRDEAVANGNTDSSFKLSDFVEQFETTWEERFHQLHENEEELNRQFIDIYGLQDELSPEVPMSEITILQQGEISIIDND